MDQVLDVNKKYETQYCIPLWLRDEQVRSACQRKLPRLGPHYESQDHAVAIVCFGPSLHDTWEEIREFKTIITCSGAHKFLVEKGIKPTYHVEVDPRDHKIALLGQPQEGVKYLIASTCHPKYFDYLVGYDVTLWHVFADDEEAFRVLPRGEWAITGGSNVGLRAMTIARFLGYKNQHVFGMDGNQRDERHKHAMPHPIQDGTPYATVEYEGKEYKTNHAMLESAKQTWHELDMMPDVVATFHGEGLVQEMAKKYVRNTVPRADKGIIGILKPELISSQYAEMNRILHRQNLGYGVSGMHVVDTVKKLAESLKTTCVLDYGCGKGYLAKSLPYPIWEYDPAIPGKEEAPRPAELVICTNVLEHIEPDKLTPVLMDLARCVKSVGYFTVVTIAAKKTLPDGRNTHLIVEKKEWWEKRLSEFFMIGTIIEQGPVLHVVVGPKIRQVQEAA